MIAQVLYSSELRQGTSKKTGRPYEGYFVDLLAKEDSGDIRVLQVGFLDKSLVKQQLLPDTMIEITFNYRGFVESVQVLKDAAPLLIRG